MNNTKQSETTEEIKPLGVSSLFEPTLDELWSLFNSVVYQLAHREAVARGYEEARAKLLDYVRLGCSTGALGNAPPPLADTISLFLVRLPSDVEQEMNRDLISRAQIELGRWFLKLCESTAAWDEGTQHKITFEGARAGYTDHPHKELAFFSINVTTENTESL